MSVGWICPKCGRALAPWVSECPCYRGKYVTNYRCQPHLPSWGNIQGGKCDKVCDNKTEWGYCRTTVCIKPEYGGDPDYGIGNNA